MKVRCHREGLLSAVQLASAAVPSRDLKPVLKNIKIAEMTESGETTGSEARKTLAELVTLS